jgi:hypothetical protein
VREHGKGEGEGDQVRPLDEYAQERHNLVSLFVKKGPARFGAPALVDVSKYPPQNR